MYDIFFNHLRLNHSLRILCFCFLASAANAQDKEKVDSLKSLVEKNNGVDKFEPLVQLAIQFADHDNVQSISYIDEAFQLGSQSGDSAKIVRAGRIKGQLLRRLERLDEAIELFHTLLPTAKRNNYTNDYKIILNSLAFAYTLKADYDEALHYNFQSLVIREAEGNKADISISLNNIGMVYFKLRNYDKATEYFEKSLLNKRAVNDTYDLDRLLINLGISNIQLNRLEEAEKYIEEGLDLCKEECSNEIRVEAQFGLGVVKFSSNNYEEAKLHFEESLRISRESGNKRFQAENLVYLAKIAIAGGENDQAKNILEESEELANTSGYNQLLIDTYKQFSILYNQAKEFESASIYQNKYIKLKDSLIGEELVKNVAKIQTNFEERENLATIKLNKEALTRQRNLNIAIGVIAVLAGLLVFVLYRSNTVTRKVNSALSDAKGIIETQNLRLQNINRELDGKVKEKTANLEKAVDDLDKANQSLSQVNGELDNFIYKTSHDIRGPLASLKGICSVALLDVKDPLALDYLNKLDVSSGRLNVILTRLLIVNQINNAIVGKEPIDFNEIVDDVILLEKKKGLPSRFEIKKDIEKDILLQTDKDLVRIILENLIDNAIKFHNDSERITPFVHIKIRRENAKRVEVSVIDNGIGIAAAKPDKIFQMFSRASERSGTGGIGLYLSKLATEKLGGEIHLRNTKEGFTEFYVTFPASMPVAQQN